MQFFKFKLSVLLQLLSLGFHNQKLLVEAKKLQLRLRGAVLSRAERGRLERIKEIDAKLAEIQRLHGPTGMMLWGDKLEAEKELILKAHVAAGGEKGLLEMSSSKSESGALTPWPLRGDDVQADPALGDSNLGFGAYQGWGLNPYFWLQEARKAYRISSANARWFWNRRGFKRPSHREERLQAYGESILYHGTTPEFAKLILDGGFMKPGKSGAVGGGIYFAPRADHVYPKAKMTSEMIKAANEAGFNSKYDEDTNYYAYKKKTLVVLACRVRLGKMKKLYNRDKEVTHEGLLEEGYDSVRLVGKKGWLARKILRLSGGPFNGDEYVVYNSDQVISCQDKSKMWDQGWGRGRWN